MKRFRALALLPLLLLSLACTEPPAVTPDPGVGQVGFVVYDEAGSVVLDTAYEGPAENAAAFAESAVALADSFASHAGVSFVVSVSAPGRSADANVGAFGGGVVEGATCAVGAAIDFAAQQTGYREQTGGAALVAHIENCTTDWLPGGCNVSPSGTCGGLFIRCGSYEHCAPYNCPFP